MTQKQETDLQMYIRRLSIANQITQYKRIPYSKLMALYGCSRRTIQRDVTWIRQQLDLPSVTKIVRDKVVGALEQCDEDVDKELLLKHGLPFLAKGVKQRVEIKEEKIVKEEIKIEVTEDEDRILSAAAKILSQKEKSKAIH